MHSFQVSDCLYLFFFLYFFSWIFHRRWKMSSCQVGAGSSSSYHEILEYWAFPIACNVFIPRSGSWLIVNFVVGCCRMMYEGADFGAKFSWIYGQCWDHPEWPTRHSKQVANFFALALVTISRNLVLAASVIVVQSEVNGHRIEITKLVIFFSSDAL